MSADYWSLSQRSKWQVTREQLGESRRRLQLLERKMVQSGLIKDHPHVVYDVNMRIYLHTLVVKLGRRLNVRQIPLSTLEVYLLRFLTKVSLKEVNVYLLVTTCLYVACKIEECPQHIRLIVLEARNLWPEYIPQEVSKLAEFEFYLVEELGMYLILHHPYKLLLQIRDFLEAARHGFQLTADDLQHLWSLLNDSYITDLHLVFPPHVIAVAVLYITVVLKKHLAGQEMGQALPIADDVMAMAGGMSGLDGQKRDEDTLKIENFMDFLNRSHVNLDEVVEAMQEMIALYVAWDRYNELLVKKALQAMLLLR